MRRALAARLNLYRPVNYPKRQVTTVAHWTHVLARRAEYSQKIRRAARVR